MIKSLALVLHFNFYLSWLIWYCLYISTFGFGHWDISDLFILPKELFSFSIFPTARLLRFFHCETSVSGNDWGTLNLKGNKTTIWERHLYTSHVEVLMPNVMILGCGAFGKFLCHESGTLMNGISALLKETRRTSLVPFTMWGHSDLHVISGRRPSPNHADTLILDSQHPEMFEINSCFL